MYELFVLINDKATLYEASQSKSALKCLEMFKIPQTIPAVLLHACVALIL